MSRGIPTEPRGVGAALTTLLALAALLAGSIARAADLEFAHGLYRQGRYALAAEEYAGVLATRPEPAAAAEASFYLAECKLQLGLPAEAADLFEAAAKGTPAAERRHRLSVLRTAQSRLLADRPEEAARTAERFLKSFSNDPLALDAKVVLAESLVALGRAPEAERAIAAALSARPDPLVVEQLEFAQARLWAKSDRWTRAVERLKELAERQSSSIADQARFALASGWFERGDFSQAAAQFAELARRHPASALAPSARLHSAHALFQGGEYDKAAAAYREIVGGAKDDGDLAAEAWYRAGLCLDAGGKLEEAARWHRDGAARYPQSDFSRDMRLAAASADLRAGRAAEAKVALSKLRTDSPAYGRMDELLYELGRAELALKDAAAVLEAHRRLVADFPKSPWVDRSVVTVAESLLANPESKGRKQTALSLLKDVKDPRAAARVGYCLAVVHYEEKDFAAATRTLEAILPDVQDADLKRNLLLALGLARTADKRPDEAIEPLLECVREMNADDRRLASASAALADAAAALEAGDAARRRWNQVRESLAGSPSGAEALLRLADRLLEKGHHRDAEEMYRGALKGSPSREVAARARLGLGWGYFEQKDHEKAAAEFRAVLADEKADATAKGEATYMAGVCAQAAGRRDEATALLRSAATDFPDSQYVFDAGRRAARLLEESGESDASEAILKAVAAKAKDPTQLSDALADQAWAAAQRGDAARAEQLFQRLAKDHGQTPAGREAALKLAEIAHEKKNLVEARSLLDRLVSGGLEGPLEAAVLYRRGLVAFEEKRYADASKDWTAIVERHPADAMAVAAEFWLAETELAQERPEEAARRFRALLAKNHGGAYQPTAWLRVAEAELAARRWQEAIAAAKEAQEKIQDPVLRGEATYVEGRAHQQLARFDEARECYARAAGAEKSELAAKAWFMTGETFFHQKRYDEALRTFLRVEILYPYPKWQAMALLEVGKCHERKKEPTEAVKAYRAVLEKYADQTAAGQARERWAALDPSAAAPLPGGAP